MPDKKTLRNCAASAGAPGKLAGVTFIPADAHTLHSSCNDAP